MRAEEELVMLYMGKTMMIEHCVGFVCFLKKTRLFFKTMSKNNDILVKGFGTLPQVDKALHC